MFLNRKRRLKRRNAWLLRYKQHFKHRHANGFGVFDIHGAAGSPEADHPGPDGRVAPDGQVRPVVGRRRAREADLGRAGPVENNGDPWALNSYPAWWISAVHEFHMWVASRFDHVHVDLVRHH